MTPSTSGLVRHADATIRRQVEGFASAWSQGDSILVRPKADSARKVTVPDEVANSKVRVKALDFWAVATVFE